MEHALEKLELIRRSRRRFQWEVASRDPLLLKDLTNTEHAFKAADAEAEGGFL